jgi:hypothetical protein
MPVHRTRFVSVVRSRLLRSPSPHAGTAYVRSSPAQSSAIRRGLTQAATKAQWLLMVTHLVYAVLAIVLAAMAVLALTAISKIEEPRPHP